MHNIEIGPLYFNLHRTVRVKDSDEGANLPPSLGHFEVYNVKDFNCPKSWDEDAYFIAMHSQEAVWIGFQTIQPVAIIISAGNINAINGKNFNNKLEKDSYMVSPPQPWIDGWKSENGNIYQFIATETRENKTVGEQLANTKDHTIVISVFKAKNPEKLQAAMVPHEISGGAEYGGLFSNCCFKSVSIELCGDNLCNEMGVGKGGKIKQKIYEDPYGIEEWEENPVKTVKIYLINASEFSEVTGKILPPLIKSEEYNGFWFGLNDKNMKDGKPCGMSHS